MVARLSMDGHDINQQDRGRTLRISSTSGQYKRDYLNIPANQQILKLLAKQGDQEVLFADSVIKVNREGLIRRQILLITNVAVYTLDNRWCNLKRRIALSAIRQLFLSKLGDHFFVIKVPSEYDCLLASTRKKEIVNVLEEAIRIHTATPLEVTYANRFNYFVDSEVSRELFFEEVDGAVKMQIVKK